VGRLARFLDKMNAGWSHKIEGRFSFSGGCCNSTDCAVVDTEGDSFALHALICTGCLNFFSAPVKSRFVSASTTDFRASVDWLLRFLPAPLFDDVDFLSAAQLALPGAKGFCHTQRVSLPHNVKLLHLAELLRSRLVAGFEMLGKMACARVRFLSLAHQELNFLEMLVHPLLAVLLSIANVEHVAAITGDFVDDD